MEKLNTAADAVEAKPANDLIFGGNNSPTKVEGTHPKP